jgi:protein disulfide-isomerase A1
MTKQSLPAVSVITEKAALEEFKTSDSVVLVAYFDKDDKTSNETYTEVANALRDDYLFGAVSSASLAEEEGVKLPSIRLYKAFDEGQNDFAEKFDKETIMTWAKTSATPLVGEVGPETYSGYMAAGIPLAYIFAETPEEREELAKELKPIAEKHKGKINFATIDAKAFGQHGGNLNLEVGKWPAFAIQETQKNQKFPYDQTKKITNKDVGAFVDDFVSGKLEPSIKSEPIPETQEGPVTIIVAKNYEEIIMDEEKDVLVEFYAPWCGHCKALAPKYEELGALYWNNKDFASKVTVAKVDATANDVPDEIQGFPTIKLYPAYKKDSPVSYSGSRTIEDLANFIKENGHYKVDAYSEEAASAKEDETELPKQAPAATESSTEGAKETVKKAASKATEAVKSAVGGESEQDVHDEL